MVAFKGFTKLKAKGLITKNIFDFNRFWFVIELKRLWVIDLDSNECGLVQH
jgi:hypothetical protein